MNGMNEGFFDLCLNLPSESNEKKLAQLLSMSYEVGYRTVAVNQNLDERTLTRKRKKDEGKEGLQNLIPKPTDVSKLSASHELPRVYTRLTFAFSEPVKTHTLAHCNDLKTYHLYAAEPKTQPALQYACSQLNADIIYINPLIQTLKLNRKLYNQAVERGIYFEIKYGDILNPETRKQAIHWARLLYVYGKSKNVIVSSGAENRNLLRNPYDVINLGLILGLGEVKAKASILRTAQSVLLKAERRRSGKSVFVVKETKVTSPD